MRFLLILALLFTGCAMPSAEGDGELAALHAGPMVGEVSAAYARIWWQTEEPGPVEVRYWPAEEPATDDARWFRIFSSEIEDGCVELGIGAADSPLKPRRNYVVELRDRDAIHRAHFYTAAPDGVAQELKVGFGSCAGNWGEDAEQPVWTAVAAADPNLFLWLGDNVYFDLERREWEDPQAMAARWRKQRGLRSLQGALRDIAHYAIWDDHDFGPDNADGGYPLKDEAFELFERYWATPPLQPDCGVYQHFRQGRVAFFLLDGRSFRAPESTPEGEPKPLLGEAQWQRLEADFAACNDGDFDWMVVVSGNQILADYHRFETWGRFPEERARLLSLLVEARGDVVLLSGDRHIGEVLTEVDPESGRRFVEITSSPLAAGIGEHTADEAAQERLAGSEIRQDHFGLLHFHQNGVEPRLSYQPIAADGTPLRAPLDVGRLLRGESVDSLPED